jgi:hypothetical protein
MLILSTGGAGGGDLVVHEVVRDDDTTLVDCLERVSCTKVSAIVIITVCIYVYLVLLGATLGKISKYIASRTHYGARRG